MPGDGLELKTTKTPRPQFDPMQILRPLSALVGLFCFVLVFACCTLVVESVYKTGGIKLAIGAAIIALCVLPLSSRIISLCTLPTIGRRTSYLVAAAEALILLNYAYHAYHQAPVKQALQLIYAAAKTIVPIG